MTDSTQTDAPLVQTLSQLLSTELKTLLEPLTRIAADPAELDALLRTLGAIPSEAQRTGILATITTVAGLVAQLEEVAAQPELSLESVERLLALGKQAFAAVRALDTVVQTSSELEGFGRDVVARLFGSYLAHAHPLLRSVAVLTTVIEEGMELAPREPIVRDELVVRQAFTLDRFHFERIAQLLSDPLTLFRTAYGASIATSAEATALAQKLFPRLHSLLTRLGLNARASEIVADEGATATAPSLTVHVDDVFLGAAADAGVTVVLSPLEHGNLGLVVVPFGTLDLERTVGAWQFRLALDAGTNAFAYGPQGLKVLDAASQTSVGATASATLPPVDTGPRFFLGSATGTRLEVGGVAVSAAAKFMSERHALAFDASMSKSSLVIAADNSDGFLAQVLPEGGLRAEFDLGLGWSSDRGFALHGAASLEGDLPVSVSIAGLTLSGVHLALRASDDRVAVEISSTFSLSIGPVYARIDRVGMQGALTFPETGGNLGPADLSLGFKPPSGMGLAIDVASVVGGGYLFFDSQKGEYGGVLQLEIAGQIAVKAVGLLSTRLPDGAKGYSLIVLITAEDFKSIPLGMGFNLVGLGGLLAINRTFAAAAMQAGLKNNTLATLLFPRDPILNAPQILRNLATLFPARSGSYLFAPMAKVTWASAKLIQMDLALIMEFGQRRRLIVLGRISSILPSRDEDLLRLNMDAMGIWDFDVGTVSLDAVLVDSRLLQKFVLTGSMAMRACLVPGPQAGFALAVGGMNPHFSPPAGMPKLDRITINLTSGDNPRFTCNAYFAITANTLQFGARASMYAAACGFSIEGDVSFDVLMQLLPFRFLADYSASIQLKHGSRNLFKVKVSGALEGPRPLRVSAKATFEILWCDFSIRFDKTLMDGEAPALPPPIDVLSVLKSALAAPENWNTELPESRRHGVTLRKLPANAALTLDPLGSLTVKQNVVPLNTHRDIDTFGGAPVGAVRRFTITAAALSGTAQSIVPAPVKDLFAPAQFFDLSEEQKLSSPSFESMDSGAQFGSDAVFIDEVAELRANAPLEYETLTVDADGVITTSPAHYELSAERLMQQLRFASVSKAAVRHAGLARFRTTAVEPAVTVTPLRWVVASTTDLNTLAPLSSTGASWADASGVLQTMLSGSPANASKWQLVPQYEVVP